MIDLDAIKERIAQSRSRGLMGSQIQQDRVDLVAEVERLRVLADKGSRIRARDKARAERDAAQAEVERLRGLLRETTDAHVLCWEFDEDEGNCHRQGYSKPCLPCRIRAALGGEEE